MEPLKLLLVSFREEWLDSLNHSLLTAGYDFEVRHVSTKKQALGACYQSKYDILITNHQLPDGYAVDLVQGLGSTVACLVISEEAPLFFNPPQAELLYTEKSYRSLMQPSAWISTLKLVLAKWEKSVTDKIAGYRYDRRRLFDKAAARCASELYQPTENRVENALKILLEVLEVSRIYVRDIAVQKSHSSQLLHEVAAPGQALFRGPFNTSFETPIRQPNGGSCLLGVEDTTYQRVWDQAETDLLKTVASLLCENPAEIRHRMVMYRELGMTA